MSTTVATPMTVEEFMALDLPEGREWELHEGELVDMGEPTLKHRRMQRRMFLILQRLFPSADVLVEYSFQVRQSVRSADVGAASKDRVSDDLLEGAPELVVEVLSPSNTVKGLKGYRQLCFLNGTQIFLTIDSDDQTVQVHAARDKDGRTFVAGEQIALELFGLSVSLVIDDIFKE